MGYTLTYGGLTKPLSGWGITQETMVLTWRSFEADTLSFSLASADALAAAPFVYGGALTLSLDGVKLFVGTVRDLPVFGAGAAERQRFTAYNFWHALEAWIYQQDRAIIDEEFAELGLVATSQIILGRDPATGLKRTNAQEIAALCAYAGLTVSEEFTGVAPPFEQASDMTLAAGIRRMAAWQPDLVGRTDYSGAAPVLRITDRPHADVHALDLTGANGIESIQAKVRHDLEISGLKIIWIKTEVNEADGKRYSRPVITPAGVPTAGPYTMIQTLNLGDGEEVPAALAAAYYLGLATAFIEGSILLAKRECDYSWKPGQMINFSHAPATWAGAVAPITEVVHDVGAGTTTLNFGPPQFLPLASFAALNAKAKDTRVDPTVPPAGAGDGPEGTTPGTHDTGVAGGGASGGVPIYEEIKHCVGGVQMSSFVRTN